MMTVRQALNWAEQTLKKAKITSAALDGEVILAFGLNQSKEFLYTYPEKKLTRPQIRRFQTLIKQRQALKPVAQIIGHKEFFGLDFIINKNVLVPRPETEMIIDEALLWAKNKKITIADIGTGSGCIAVALAKKLPQATIYATDISAAALAVAKKNAKKHQTKIKFFPGDLLNPLKGKKIDLIIANLPYGALRGEQKFVWKKNTLHSIKHEPAIAIDGGQNGLAILERFFRQLKKLRNKPRLILLEFDPDQKIALLNLARKYLPGLKSKIKKDLAGHNRLLIIRDLS